MGDYTFRSILKENYKKWREEPFLYERKSDEYQPISFGEVIERSVFIAHALIDQGLKDKKIAIYAQNSAMWMCADLAIMSYVGISVGFSKEFHEEDLIRCIKKFEIDAFFYSDAKSEIVNAILPFFPKLPTYNLDHLETLVAKGREIAEKKADIFDFSSEEQRKEDSYVEGGEQLKDCVKVVLTAGTTSMPKGVCLSEKNIFAGYQSLSRRAPMDDSDICYLFLPLHHTYAGIYNFIYSLISGMKIYLSSGVEHIAEELQMVNPTVFCGVPLIFKNFYLYAQIDPKKLSKCFGNRIKYLFTGGAYLEEGIRAFYHACGLKLLSAYALSETSSSLAIDYSDTTNFISCGRVFEDILIKIHEEDESGIGEILVKGDCVFLGYMNDEKATIDAFDSEGYFKTGDLGFLDEEGNIYLAGRKKKVLISAHGENIYPDDIEEKLKEKSPNINKIRIFLMEDELRAHFFVKEEDEFDYKELIKAYNQGVPKYRKISGFEVFIDSVEKRLKQ